MNQYLSQLIPRLRAYGQKLDKKESFVDKKWTLLDEFGQVKTYRFKRNGDLRISVNGNFSDFQWELEGLDAISIREHGKRSGEMFRHAFVLDGLLVVQKEGRNTEPTVFFNEDVVQDGDVERYIRSEIIYRMNLKPFGDGFYIRYNQSDNTAVGSKIYNSSFEEVGDKDIITENQSISVRNSIIRSIVVKQKFNSDIGNILVEKNLYGEITKGDRVYYPNGTKASGKFTIINNGSKVTIFTEAGVITKIKELQNSAYTAFIFGLLILATLGLLYFFLNKNSNTEEISAKPAVDTAIVVKDAAVPVAPATTMPTNVVDEPILKLDDNLEENAEPNENQPELPETSDLRYAYEKDDYNQDAEITTLKFFNYLNAQKFNEAWNLTRNPKWEVNGLTWFSSVSAFGGINSIKLKSVNVQDCKQDFAKVYVSYFAEDSYNGNKCFEQLLYLVKTVNPENRTKWLITRMGNISDPYYCEQ